MSWEHLFRKLPGTRREPPGLEQRIWKKLPLFFLAGTTIPLIAYAYAHLFPAPGSLSEEKYLNLVGILVTATIVTAWTAVFTVGIGCFVVRVMKGPGYVADQYPLIDADEPRKAKQAKPQDAADRGERE